MVGFHYSGIQRYSKVVGDTIEIFRGSSMLFFVEASYLLYPL